MLFVIIPESWEVVSRFDRHKLWPLMNKYYLHFWIIICHSFSTSSTFLFHHRGPDEDDCPAEKSSHKDGRGHSIALLLLSDSFHFFFFVVTFFFSPSSSFRWITNRLSRTEYRPNCWTMVSVCLVLTSPSLFFYTRLIFFYYFIPVKFYSSRNWSEVLITSINHFQFYLNITCCQ